MTIERIGIVSAGTAVMPPSQLCASEFEDVLHRMLGAPILPVMADAGVAADARFDRLIFVAMNYWQLSRMIQASAALRRRAGSCQAYVFDSFHRHLERWTSRFPTPLRPVARLMRHELRNVRHMSRIFVPTHMTIAAQQAYLDVPLDYLPIGVDAVRFGSRRQDRTIDVNAYGRQPPAVTAYLADLLNVRDGRYRFNHTDHLASITVADPRRHRALFWRTLTDSRIALAYAPEVYDPHDRFECSFVGQRWYESIAAGCVVMGMKPQTPESARLFDWPDALIDLPEDPAAAWAAIAAMLDDPQRMAAISRRNHAAALARHDWRHRIDAMMRTLGIAVDARFHAELATATAPAS